MMVMLELACALHTLHCADSTGPDGGMALHRIGRATASTKQYNLHNMGASCDVIRITTQCDVINVITRAMNTIATSHYNVLPY
jgi:hypothetical protein